MSTEEKAKAYDEALKWMRELYPGLHGATKEDAEHYFPELRESEDERMLREFNDWLCEEIECRTNDLRDEKDRRTLNMLCYVLTKVKDWLEKQKELNPPVDVDPCDASWDAYYQRGLNKGYELGLEAGRKEQKPELVQQPPITYTYNSNASRDERLKAALLALLNSDLLKVKEGGYFTKQDLIEWVERIPTEKPAWNEEDEEMRLEAIRVLVSGCERYRKESGCLPSWHKVIDWLKFLRPQPKRCCKDCAMFLNGKCTKPHWKPSEEQMNHLCAAVDAAIRKHNESVSGYEPARALKSLYEDLKKLM